MKTKSLGRAIGDKIFEEVVSGKLKRFNPEGATPRDLWEILIPTVRPSGKPIRTRFHRVWDAKIRAVSGGVSIMPPTKGQWISPNGTLFHERMIPVRVLATRAEIERIVDMSLVYYEQQAILAYKISGEVILKYAASM